MIADTNDTVFAYLCCVIDAGTELEAIGSVDNIAALKLITDANAIVIYPFNLGDLYNFIIGSCCGGSSSTFP